MSDQSSSRLAGLFDNRLPINRKERYYTGTVLPMIVASDGFAHLNRFLELCEVSSDVAVNADPSSCNIEFFTEYGFKESLKGGAEERFSVPPDKSTPDLVVYIESDTSLLLSVEAKLFENVSDYTLKGQLHKQADLLHIMSEGVGTRPLVHQVALLPAKLGIPGPIGDVPVITWEQVACAFRDVAPPYWRDVLDEALSRYDILASKSAKRNYDAKITGRKIHNQHKEGNDTYTWMGRKGGLHGSKIQDDLRTGDWKKHRYPVRHESLLNKDNWFSVEEFIQKIDGSLLGDGS